MTTCEDGKPIHPGEILREEFLRPMGVSVKGLARELGVPVARMQGIVDGTRGISADMAVRLAAYFDMAPETWLYLQSEYDLRMARRVAGEEIARTVRKRVVG